jgi:hypothetical protein
MDDKPTITKWVLGGLVVLAVIIGFQSFDSFTDSSADTSMTTEQATYESPEGNRVGNNTAQTATASSSGTPEIRDGSPNTGGTVPASGSNGSAAPAQPYRGSGPSDSSQLTTSTSPATGFDIRRVDRNNDNEVDMDEFRSLFHMLDKNKNGMLSAFEINPGPTADTKRH